MLNFAIKLLNWPLLFFLHTYYLQPRKKSGSLKKPRAALHGLKCITYCTISSSADFSPCSSIIVSNDFCRQYTASGISFRDKLLDDFHVPLLSL